MGLGGGIYTSEAHGIERGEEVRIDRLLRWGEKEGERNQGLKTADWF